MKCHFLYCIVFFGGKEMGDYGVSNGISSRCRWVYVGSPQSGGLGRYILG
jgi:hypothetical protein